MDASTSSSSSSAPLPTFPPLAPSVCLFPPREHSKPSAVTSPLETSTGVPVLMSTMDVSLRMPPIAPQYALSLKAPLPDLATFSAGAKDQWAYLEQVKATTNVSDMAKILAYPTAMCPVNQPKNRYQDAPPNEGTRVYLGATVRLGDALQANDADAISQLVDELTPCDASQLRRTGLPVISTVNYINANYLVSTRDWICTQAPLPRTFLNFWHMVWTNHVKVIFALVSAKDVETGKADQYWPAVVGESLTFGQTFKVTLIDVDDTHETCCGYVHRRFLLELCPELLEKVAQNSAVVTNTSLGQNTAPFEVHQLHHTQWPDMGCATNIRGVLNMLKRGDELAGRSGFVWKDECKKSPGLYSSGEQAPVIVHCSAGLGRSGTLVAIYEVCCELQREERVRNIAQQVSHLRTFRHGLVQTEQQFLFIYYAVWEYINKMQ